MKLVQKKLQLEGECLIWTGCVNSDGYPKLGRKRADGTFNFNVKGHRYVYEQTKGVIPAGMVVRHTCDNILCLNPEHLIVGTTTDNMRDRKERGRTYNHVTQEVVDEIIRLRATGLSQSKVAKIVGCSQTHISKLELGRYKLN